MTRDELIAQALQLSPRDRALLAEELLTSLEEPEDVVAAAWVPELERRVRDVEEGRVKPIPWEQVHAEITEHLEQRRAHRDQS